MDYFAYSPFWDSKSNNNVLRTQRRVENPTYGHAEEKIELNAFKSGFEYIVAHAQPPELFVIHKREVEPTGKRERVTGAWFVLHEKIYQSPTVYGVVSTRLRNAAHLISRTLGTLSESRPASNPRSTTVWRSITASASSSSSSQPKPTSTFDPAPSGNMEVDDAGDEKEKNGAVDGENGEEGSGQGQEFDWHLFHALQSTRSALSNIDEMARKPLSTSDPRAELRSIEANMTSQFSFLPQAQAQSQGQNQGRPSSVRSISIGPRTNFVNNAGLTPGLSPGLGSIFGNVAVGGSLAASSPRTTLGMGISPAPRAASIAAASPGIWTNGQN
ncbi:hypothetical protein I316_05399 [Kwoniella heveanensis BCC8398]|uniref:Mediator of RNA polymerase II transcription subunit 6 n=1 Tax=Kwoniella heveanensis BCC8398 TaxID=1296120 RepID=A0A1B9GPR2_9TREE|nr:hypothetical protein I316_05399 [Kwoniella heveanensis BCC8398]